MHDIPATVSSEFAIYSYSDSLCSRKMSTFAMSAEIHPRHYGLWKLQQSVHIPVRQLFAEKGHGNDAKGDKRHKRNMLPTTKYAKGA
jgi:hypothetical protein